MYEEAIGRVIAETEPKLILDVGGGKCCSFSKRREALPSMRIVSLDISHEEIRQNSDVDYGIVADVIEGLPFRRSSVDLIAWHMAMEHIEDTGALVESSKAVLKTGGYCIHAFACKFAPYALINQLLPDALSRKIIYLLRPEKRGVCGFPAAYNRCYCSAMRDLLLSNDFEIISMEPIFYQSVYFDFFLPFFLISVLYETVVASLGLKNLCAYLLVVARKRAPGSVPSTTSR
jgi:SAM-dependent methyltransferase